MSIEGSGSATGPKTVAGAESHGIRGKGKAKTGTEADALASGGFLALLTSLEPQADVGAGGAGTADQSEAAAQRPTVEKPQMAVLTPSDPSSFLAQNLPNDVAMLLAQAGVGVGSKGANDESEGVAPPMSNQEQQRVAIFPPLAPAILVTQAGEVAGEKLSAGSDARPVGGRSGVRSTVPAMGADKPETPVAASASRGGEKTGDFAQYVDAMLDQSAQTRTARPLKAGGAEFQSGAGASLAEARALSLPSLMDISARDPAISGSLVTSGIGDSFLRHVDRASSKSSLVAGGSGIEGLWGQHALLADSRTDAPSVMSDPTMLSLDLMVADTVSYWVSQGVQNAELKLDGFGGEPVEVTISLKGGEAHIDFRTDQPEVRQVLEGAVAHLKELLASEGLVLSGVSVGTSGQDGTGAQERRHGPDVRQATITTADVVSTESPKRVNQSAGRVVDLFV